MADKNQSGLKGNPAAKRMQNKALKERRARSWRNGQIRKRERVWAQGKRREFNDTLRAAGIALYGPEGKARRAEAGFRRGHN